VEGPPAGPGCHALVVRFWKAGELQGKKKPPLLPLGQVDMGFHSNVIMGDDEDTDHQTGLT
jgi:hypothetical protein